MNYKKIIILVKTGIRETVCERGDGMGTTGHTAVGRETVGNWADSGTGTVRRDGRRREKKPRTGRVDNSRSETENRVVSRCRTVPFPAFTARSPRE